MILHIFGDFQTTPYSHTFSEDQFFFTFDLFFFEDQNFHHLIKFSGFCPCLVRFGPKSGQNGTNLELFKDQFSVDFDYLKFD